MSQEYSVIYLNLDDGSKVLLDKPLNSPYKQIKYIQNEPASIWTIIHNQNINSYVSFFYDSYGNQIDPSKHTIGSDRSIAEFSSPLSGFAILLFFYSSNTIPSPSITPTPSPSITPSVTSTPAVSLTPYPTITPTITPTTTPSSVEPTLMISSALVAPLGMDSTNANFTCQSIDDDFRKVGPLPFDFYFNGVNYGNDLNGGIYVGSNGYVTFGAGSSDYDITASAPGKAILVHASDNSAQYIGEISHADSDGYTIRYEGYNSPGGTSTGSSNMIWEITFYKEQKIQLAIGDMARGIGDGVCGISDGTQYILTTDFNANTSYVIYDADGISGSGLSWLSQEGSISGASLPLAASPVPRVSNYLGALDTSGISYKSTLNLNLDNTVYLTKAMTDGKYLISGVFSTVDGNTYNNTAILNNDLTVDTSFTNISIRAMAVLETSSAIYLGCSSNTNIGGTFYSTLFRVNKDYTIDTTYTCPYNNGTAFALVQALDGKIYVGGSSSITDAASNIGSKELSRLNSDGSFDSSYSLNITGTGSVVNTILQTSDGKIYVGGKFTQFGGSTYNSLGRLNSDGTLDTSFTGLTFSFYTNGAIQKIVQTSDGYIYIVGGFANVNSVLRPTIIRLNPDGTLDTTFSYSVTNDNGSTLGYDFKVVGDKMYLGGAFTSFNGSPYYGLARLNSDGSADMSFQNIPVNWQQLPPPEIYTLENASGLLLFGGTFLTTIC